MYEDLSLSPMNPYAFLFLFFGILFLLTGIFILNHP